MSTKKAMETVGAVGQIVVGGKGKHVDLLDVGEFRDRFVIPNGVSVQLLEGEAIPTHKADDNSVCFTKEQFNAGLHLPLSSLFK